MLGNLLVIASSAKNRGACIACIDVKTGQFVRPIPYRIGNKQWNFDPLEIPILSLWEIPLLDSENNIYQPENYYANSREKWRCIKRRIDYSTFLQIAENFTQFVSLLNPKGYLFVTEVEKMIEEGKFSSINLLQVEDAVLFLKEENSTPRLWICFYKNGLKYEQKVTYKLNQILWDKLKENFYKKEHFKVELHENIFLTLTGAVFGEFYNIFVSGIIMKEPLDFYLEKVLT